MKFAVIYTQEEDVSRIIISSESFECAKDFAKIFINDVKNKNLTNFEIFKPLDPRKMIGESIEFWSWNNNQQCVTVQKIND